MPVGSVERPAIAYAACPVARVHDLAGAGEIQVVDVHSVVDNGDRDVLSLGNGPRRHDVGVLVDDVPVDRGFLEVPLLWCSNAAGAWPNKLGVAQLDIFVIEQLFSERKYLAPDTFGSLYEVCVVCVFELAFNPQTGGLKYLFGGARTHVFLEFYEEILRVEDGVVGAGVCQDTPRKFDVAGF